MVNVSRFRSCVGKGEGGLIDERAGVKPREFCPAAVVVVQMTQFYSEDGGLQFVESAVDSGDFADVSLVPTIFAQRSHLPGKFGIVSNHCSAIAERSHIFC